MLLNRDQIRAQKLIVEGFSNTSLRLAGYDLRVQTLITKRDGASERSDDDCDLEPQGIVAVVSQEIVKLPPDICAFASVKTSLCREGVVAINVGLIDPGWEGPISSVLLNFGRGVHRLKQGDCFLRLTFHKVEPAEEFVFSVPKQRSEYELEIRQKFDKRLGASYMDFDRAAERVSKKYITDIRDSLFKYVPICALLLAVLTFFLNFALMSTVSRIMPDSIQMIRAQTVADTARKETEELKNENRELMRQIEELRVKVDTPKK